MVGQLLLVTSPVAPAMLQVRLVFQRVPLWALKQENLNCAQDLQEERS